VNPEREAWAKIKSMTYYGAKDLAAAFRTVRNNTIQIAEEIPEGKYSFEPAPGARTVAQTLVHIATSYRFNYQVHGIEKRTTMEGFDFPKFIAGVMADEQKPRNKAEIVQLLKESGDTVEKWLGSLSEDFLAQSVSMPPHVQPASKTRFEMLSGIKEHEMHHRGQLMLVQRMLGITPHLTRQMQERFAAMQSAAKS
jgi:uncharacterized damage-inducible protein DinB